MIALAIVIALAQARAQAQAPPPQAPPQAPAQPRTPAPVPPVNAPAPTSPDSRPAGIAGKNYRIGPGDILHVAVFGHEDMNVTVVVQPTGSFVFPLIGSVQAVESTPEEVAARIAQKLAKGLIRDAQVSVMVQEYRSKVVFVVGEVSRPGSYPLAGETTLVELLARAGPMAPNAGSEVVIVRPSAPVDRPLLPAEAKVSKTASGIASSGTAGGAPDRAAKAEVLRVDVRAIEAGQLEKNVALRAGDTVFVPQAAKVFVTGEVRNPGAFAYGPGLTVRQAVSLAGGFTEDASKGSARVVRQAFGRANTIKLKLDDLVQPGDTVVVKAKLF